jgi:hypothetical protein
MKRFLNRSTSSWSTRLLSVFTVDGTNDVQFEPWTMLSSICEFALPMVGEGVEELVVVLGSEASMRQQLEIGEA